MKCHKLKSISLNRIKGINRFKYKIFKNFYYKLKMTEKYWQNRQTINKKDSLNGIIQRTYDDKKEKIPRKHFKELYYECLKGSLDLKLWAMSDELNVDDMALLACRDVGCELSYCQNSMTDPYERPFENCEQHQSALFGCIDYQINMYNKKPLASTIQEHLKIVLENKKNKKYDFLFNKNQKEKNFELYYHNLWYKIKLGLPVLNEFGVKNNEAVKIQMKI